MSWYQWVLPVRGELVYTGRIKTRAFFLDSLVVECRQNWRWFGVPFSTGVAERDNLMREEVLADGRRVEAATRIMLTELKADVELSKKAARRYSSNNDIIRRVTKETT